jgi:GNAT superfamily N-acetyltransferase
VNGSAQVGAGIARAFTIVDEGMDHLLVGSADAGMLAARACTVVDNTMDFIVVGSAPAAERAAVAVTKGNTFLEDGFVAASEGAALAVLRLAPDHRRRGAGKELGDKTTARYDRVTRLRAGPLSPSWTLGNLGFAVAVIAAFATFIIIAVAL